jgi:hypothetical protein
MTKSVRRREFLKTWQGFRDRWGVRRDRLREPRHRRTRRDPWLAGRLR